MGCFYIHYYLSVADTSSYVKKPHFNVPLRAKREGKITSACQ